MFSLDSTILYIVQHLFIPTLFNGLYIIDGLVNSCYFIIKYITFLSKLKNNSDNIGHFVRKKQKKIINTSHSLYKLNIIDRYILYALLYFVYQLLYFYYLKIIWASLSIIMSIPFIQNNIKYVSIYIKYRKIFIKYIISKSIIHYIKKITDNQLVIKHSHIFILYKYLTIDLFYDFLKNATTIYIFYFLHKNTNLYYYYEAIKMAFYYYTKYKFKTIDKHTAIFILNIIIKEKRWVDVSKLEVVNAIYVLSWGDSKFKDILMSSQIYILLLSSIISFILFIKYTHFIIKTILCICALLYAKFYNKHDYILKYCMIIIYILFVINANEYIILFILLLKDILYYIITELFLFIKERDNIIKMLHFLTKNNDNYIIL